MVSEPSAKDTGDTRGMAAPTVGSSKPKEVDVAVEAAPDQLSPDKEETSTPWRSCDSHLPTAAPSRANSLTLSKSGDRIQGSLPCSASVEPPYHVLPRRRKLCIVLLVSLAASFSPFSTNIYFPALDLIANDLNTNNSVLALSISVYIVAQGLAPSFWGPLADAFGRRQILLYTLVFYVAANVGLAITNHFEMLMVFRFLQGVGSASTISIGAGIIADIAPPAERGGFIGTFAGVRQFAMAIGPVLGGVLGHKLGWHAIFWFLVALSVVAVIPVFVFLPETHRGIAGNGSIRLSGLRYQPLYEKFRPSKRYQSEPAPDATRARITWRDFVQPMAFLLEKDVACTLFFGGVIYTVWSMVISSTSVLLAEHYQLDVLEVGLCFLPNGAGCIVGSIMAGRQLDKDYKATEDSYRYQKGLSPDFPLPKGKLPADFPLEHARLSQLATMVPLLIFGTFVYGMSVGSSASLALPLVAQFVIGYSSTAVLNLNNTLTVDLYPGKSASASAVNNMARSALGAIGVSLTNIALERIGSGLLCTILSCIVVVCSVTAVAEWKYGMKWRNERTVRLQQAKEKREQLSSV